MIKKVLVGTVLLALPLMANAEYFKIENRTAGPISLSFNGVCDVNNFNVPMNSIKYVAPETFGRFCKDVKNCVGNVFQSNDCKGTLIAVINFNAKDGKWNDYYEASNYAFTWTAYYLGINSALVKKA